MSLPHCLNPPVALLIRNYNSTSNTYAAFFQKLYPKKCLLPSTNQIKEEDKGKTANNCFHLNLQQLRFLKMLRRVTKEMNQFKENPVSNVHFLHQTSSKDHGFEIVARIIGPQDSPYAFSMFNVSVRVPTDYPFRPPKISFITKIYHPNVFYASGEVCCCTIPQLKDAWSPLFTIPKLLEMIVNMLKNPLETLSQCGDRQTINEFKNKYDRFVEKAKREAKEHGEKNQFD